MTHRHDWHRTGERLAPELWRVHCACGLTAERRSLTDHIFAVRKGSPDCLICAGVPCRIQSYGEMPIRDDMPPTIPADTFVVTDDIFEQEFGPNPTAALWVKVFITDGLLQ